MQMFRSIYHFKSLCNHPDKLSYLKKSYLSQGDLAYERIILGLDELLDGNDLPCVPVPALEHHSVTPLAEFAKLLVSLHETRRSSGSATTVQYTTAARPLNFIVYRNLKKFKPPSSQRKFSPKFNTNSFTSEISGCYKQFSYYSCYDFPKRPLSTSD